jgi:hypothetical protein
MQFAVYIQPAHLAGHSVHYVSDFLTQPVRSKTLNMTLTSFLEKLKWCGHG